MLHILHKLVRLDGLKAWLAILFFCVLPTSLLWVTQIHKDGLVFLSSFLFLFGTQKALGLFNDGSRFWRGFGSTFTLLTLGILIGWVARPYLVDVFVLVLLALAFYFTGKGLVLLFLGKKKSIVSYCVPLGLIFLSGLTFKVLKGVSLSPVPLPTQKIVGLQSFYIVKKEGEEKATPSTNTTSFFPSEIEQEKAKSIKVEENTALHRDPWTFTWWIPNFVDRRLYTMSQIRLGYSRTPGASNFDTDKQFLSAKELLQYVPRAFQIMFFAPFPSFFQKEGVELGFFRKAVFLEVLLSYLLFPLFILQWIRNRKNEAYWLFVLTTLSFMFVYTITVINLGTLHRFRYGFYHLLLASGIPLLWELKRVFKREKFKTLRVEDACLNPA